MKNLTIEDIVYINELTKLSQQDLINLGLGAASNSLGKDNINSFIIKHKKKK